MRVLGEGVAIEACIEDLSAISRASPRELVVTRMLETPWSLVICVRRVCPPCLCVSVCEKSSL